MGEGKDDLVQGTLELLILKTVALEAMHGYGISVRIRQMSREVFQINQGSLYPALHRLERRGLLESDWGESENNRRAKYYRLTRSGRKHLERETESWERLADAIRRILQTA
jgi:transcriptional regulator